MVMKEIPREESAEEKPLLTMTSQVGGARGSEEAVDTTRVTATRELPKPHVERGTRGARGTPARPLCPLGARAAPALLGDPLCQGIPHQHQCWEN